MKKLKNIQAFQKEIEDLENRIKTNENSENFAPGNDQNRKLTDLETLKNNLNGKKETLKNLLKDGPKTSVLPVSPYATKSHTVPTEDFDKVFDKKASEEEIQRIANIRNDQLPEKYQNNKKRTVLADGDLDRTEFKVPGKISSHDNRFIIYESVGEKKLIQFQWTDGKWKENILTKKIEVGVTKDGVIFQLVPLRTESNSLKPQLGSTPRTVEGTRTTTRGSTARPPHDFRGCSGSSGNTRNR